VCFERAASGKSFGKRYGQDMLSFLIDWVVSLFVELALLDRWYHLLGFLVIGFVVGQQLGGKRELQDALSIQEKKVAESKREKERLERELSGALTRGSALRRELVEQSELRAAREEELSAAVSLQSRSAEVDQEIRSSNLQLAEWRTKASRFESLLESAQSELRQNELVHESELERVRRELQLKCEQLDQATKELSLTNGRIFVLEENIKFMEERAGGMSDAVVKGGETQKERDRYRSELAASQQQLQDERAMKMSLQLDLTSVKNENVELRTRLAASTRQKESRDGDVASLTNRCEDLERQVKKKTASAKGGAGGGNGAESGEMSYTDTAGAFVAGTFDLLSTPIKPFFGMSADDGGAIERTHSADPLSPTPTRTNKEELVRTHERLKQKRRQGQQVPSLVGRTSDASSPQRQHPSDTSGGSGVLGKTMLPLANLGPKTPLKSEFRA